MYRIIGNGVLGLGRRLTGKDWKTRVQVVWGGGKKWLYIVMIFASHANAHQRVSTMEDTAKLTEEHNQLSVILCFQLPQCLHNGYMNLEAIEDAI